MKLTSMGSLLALLGWVACAPEDKTLTEVIVTVDADPMVRALSKRLVVRIKGSAGMAGLVAAPVQHEQTIPTPDYPLRIALTPLAGDESRVFWLEAESQTADRQAVSEARIVGHYTGGQLREATLRLDDECLHTRCANPLETCRQGRCIDAREVQGPQDTADGGQRDGAAPQDAGLSRPEAGEPDARVMPRDADAGERGSDAAALAEPPDASTPVGLPDAAVQVPDAGMTVPARPSPTMLPAVSPTGACPAIVDGTVTFPAFGDVRVWRNAAADPGSRGPLLFYWHGTDATPAEAPAALGIENIAAITAIGGLVVAPVQTTSQGLDSTGNGAWRTGDFDFADQILACALQQNLMIDPRRIHAVGFDAGGIHSAWFAYARSRYVASFASLSGGTVDPLPATQDVTNQPPGLVVYGGAADRIEPVIDFVDTSNKLLTEMQGRGAVALDCANGGGHELPIGSSSWIWPFLRDHQYKVSPSPYAAGLPSLFPAYCVLHD